MTTFRLTINCDGADLAGPNPPGPDPHALARVLIDLGHKLAAGHMPGSVLDLNGNTVGTVELTETEPVDMERVRELVAEFGDDLGTGSGIGDCTMVDTAALRALYNAVFGLGDGDEDDEDESDDPDAEAVCDECGETYRAGDGTEAPELDGIVCLGCAAEFDLLADD